MKRWLFFAVPLFFLFLGFGIVTIINNRNADKGELQATATPNSSVYINGKPIGKTPLCLCSLSQMLPSGDYTIKLIPLQSDLPPFEGKITITGSTLTAVDWLFGKESQSEGSIIGLSGLPSKSDLQVLITSFPQGAQVTMDSSAVGITPLLLKNTTESDHDIRISRDGYKDKLIRIHTRPGYKVTVTVYLAINLSAPTPTPAPSASPFATPTPTAKITILQTPNGFLNVRAQADVTSTRLTTVTPGESFDLVSEQSGWYQIKLTDGTLGWVSSQYAQKQ
ncbi:MAG TPA: PEGA domain-containing protein [Candidatus Saccharimonadales bacterium]|nr:PEGA domain-containing protein [Candidatus Saccharimonadales bacterium]